MKPLSKKSVLVAGAVIAVIGFAPRVWADIANSAHDFSGQSWTTEICEPCHTPHDGTTGLVAPLWNHALTTNTSFTVYSSTTLTATDLGDPSDLSKLCLSCHDGSVNVDAFGGASGSSSIGAGFVVGSGGDLSQEHPISFTYDASLVSADGGLEDPNAASTLGGSIKTDLLKSGKIECASCHDVHNDYGNTALLNIDNAGSDLCLTCHLK
jgi:predicted CXXCH cytochrome family protein